MQFSAKLAQQFGEQSLSCKDGFVLWEQTGEKAEISALYAADGKLSPLLGALLKICTAQCFTLSLPCTAATETCARTAMLQALSPRAKAQNIQNAYIGLTLG